MDLFSPGDFCPCGSGKKIIDCCGRGEFGKFFVGCPKYDESSILKDIIENSHEFENFYLKERGKIKKYIVWRGVINKNELTPGIGGNSKINPESGLSIITLKNFPPKIRDAILIAHEMEHIILSFEKFPSVPCHNGYEKIPRLLSSMIEDVVVDERLSNYGFDVTDSYLKEFKESKRQLSSVHRVPTDPEVVIQYTFQYAGLLLAFNRLFDKSYSKPSFFLFFDIRFSSIATDAKNLTQIIEEKGYDTPEKAKEIYNFIITRYNLNGKMWVS
jgi:hypothetical protein